MTVPGTELERLVGLLGANARLLSLPEPGREGADVDCAVSSLDPLWPLRLTGGWRVCQNLWQDVRCRRWILERGGEVLEIDVLDDPGGLGRDGFPSGAAAEGSGPLAMPSARAAYLAAKSIRRGDVDPARWQRVRELAHREPDRFRELLAAVLGGRAASGAAGAILAGGPLPAGLRRAQVVRRFASPLRVASIAVLSARRAARRLLDPTGLVVVVVGPDGAGKSTLAGSLPAACGGLFRRSLRLHSRPGLLPRPGALAGRPPGDPSRPHTRPPHGPVVSTALIFYYWADFLLGGWLRIRPAVARTGLVVVERGWWDLLVDPRRYRLRPPAGLVRVLGALLPKPDLVLVLEAPSAVLEERKGELPPEELARQARSWRSVPATLCILDASRPVDRVVGDAREEIVQRLHERAISRLGSGWVGFAGGRWLFPRGPRVAARASLGIYQPVTVRSRIGWEIARALAGLGAFRLLPRRRGPAPEVLERLGGHVPPGCTLAVSRSTAPNRSTALAVAQDGAPRFVAKLATEEAGIHALAAEAQALSRNAASLPAPLEAPRTLAVEEGALILEYVPWRPRLRPWRLPADAARGLGALASTGRAHGDCAAWNLLQTGTGWTLVDWEEAREDAPPFFDLVHYLVRSHTHLGRPSRRALAAGLGAGRGWVGEAVRAYAEGAGLDPGRALEELRLYSEAARSPAGVAEATL